MVAGGVLQSACEVHGSGICLSQRESNSRYRSACLTRANRFAIVYKKLRGVAPRSCRRNFANGYLPPPPVPLPVPVLVPGAPVLVASTPKCEFTRCAHAESMVGHVVLLKDGALCKRVASTFAINWSPLPRLIRRHGIATNFPPIGVP